VFSSGPLFDALRATMSIPGVFAPLRLGEQVLVDGGLLNNIPIDVVKRMGAEVINRGRPRDARFRRRLR